MEYIIAAGLLQVIICVAFLLPAGKKSVADYMLVILLCCIGWHMATKLYIFTEVSNPAVIFRMQTFIQLAYGPLMYLYARKKSDFTFIPAKMWYLFVPVIMTTTLYAIVAIGLWQYPGYSTRILNIYNNMVFFPIIISHVAFSYFMPVKALLNTSPADYRLALSFRWLLAAMAVTKVTLVVFGNYNPAVNPYIRSVLYLLLCLVPIAILAFRLIAQPQAYGVLPHDADEEKAIRKRKSKVQETTPDKKERLLLLTEEEHKALYTKLEGFMQEKAPYKDDNLTLEKLAALTGLNRHHISETLNVYAGQPFYTYINKYRVAAVIKKLEHKEGKTRLLAIAYDCGFKTKASFNQYFKAVTGQTPSAYVRQPHEIKEAV